MSRWAERVKNVMASPGICDSLGQRDGRWRRASTRGGVDHRAAGGDDAIGWPLRAAGHLHGLDRALGTLLTATGDLSRNRRSWTGGIGTGPTAGRGALADLGHVAEGVYSAPDGAGTGKGAGVEMPITAAVVVAGRTAYAVGSGGTPMGARRARRVRAALAAACVAVLPPGVEYRDRDGIERLRLR